MMQKIILFLLAIISLSGQLLAQKEACFPILENSRERLGVDISYLSSDELKGREPGTDGAELAARYIANRFRQLGLSAVFEDNYYQNFEINSGVNFPPARNSFIWDEKQLELDKDFYPLSYSSNGEVNGKTVYVKYGIQYEEKGYDDYKKLKNRKLRGKVFVMDVSSPDGVHPHSEYKSEHSLAKRIQRAIDKGAIAVIFINGEGNASDPVRNYRHLNEEGIPVVFVQNKDVAKRLKKGRKVYLKTHLVQQKINAMNVVGMIDNGAKQTVVVGAHYDHLGMGGSSSLYREEEPLIHNGADDNASGTAGLLEIAANIKNNPETFKNYNYLFAAFSGEEMGLLGSSFFVKNMPLESQTVNYMFNLDMIGRLEDNLLAVNGTGTSPIWEKVITNNPCKKLKIKESKSGVGPSDHSSFYYLEIPALHFFSGTHADYHKPSDDFELIEIDGVKQIVIFILTAMRELENHPEIEFTHTATSQMKAPRFSVTLGVLPDYMYSEKGMKIDGVTAGKPAAMAGLKAGDVVIKMGEYNVENMMGYMEALSAFKAGDKIELIYLRDGRREKTQVQF